MVRTQEADSGKDKAGSVEGYRHQCEVRYVLMLRKYGNKFAADYLFKVLEARGQAAYNKLNADQISQWSKGNRGNKGEWYE